MDGLLKYLKGRFFTEAVTYLLALSGFVVAIIMKKKKPMLKPLIFFFLAYVLDKGILFFIKGANLSWLINRHYFDYVDFFDTIIEFWAFFLVIKNYLLNSRIRRVHNFLLPFFLGVTILSLAYYVAVYNQIDQYFLQGIFTIEALILIIACVFYYIDIFKSEPKIDLRSQPSFWVVTGLAFFMLSTLPFSFLGLYLIKANYRLYAQLFIIFEVFYWILFLMVIKAYFCKPERVYPKGTEV